MRALAFRFLLGAATIWLALTLLTNLSAAALGSVFPVLHLFAKMPLESLLVALVFSGVTVSIEHQSWTHGSYATIGGCLGMMASVFAGAYTLGEEALTSNASLLIIGGVTAYGVALGVLSLLTWRFMTLAMGRS